MSNIFDLFKKIEKKEEPLPITHIVVGLGNPGAEYAVTRHNAGFLAIDSIAQSAGVKIDKAKFKALVTEATIGGVRVLLMKPQTYMNSSGEAIGEAVSFYKIPPERVIVLHDEISFDPGLMRIRRKGSAGGHNGLKSIIAHLSSDAFPRIKIGVGQKPSPDYDLINWVLGRFSADDVSKLEGLFKNIEASVELIINGKIDEAMNKFSK
ncbi:MAG: aminoacyl-tRNA hydrolase [Ruminococcaceae bacterium]|nr:aminoacyl-tRNA hydrolase [Oscillospiraceae bacterium]